MSHGSWWRRGQPLVLLTFLGALALLVAPLGAIGADAQATVTAQSVVMSTTELGSGWVKYGEREYTAAGTNLYDISYARGLETNDPRIAEFTIAVTQSADQAEAI